MSSALEFHDSRISHIGLMDGRATIYFSVAYIHKSRGKPGREPGAVWTQEAQLVMDDATFLGEPPALPNTIAEGHIEVGGVKHDLIPLPFKRKVAATLRLMFEDGTGIEIAGLRPALELMGQPIRLEDFP